MERNKSIAQIAIPAILANLTDPVLSLTDNYFISHVSSTAIAGVGLSTAIFMSLLWVVFSLKGAISAYTAQLLGTKEQAITTIYPNIIVQMGLLGLLLCGLLLGSKDFLFSLIFQAKSEIITYAAPYLAYRALGLPFILITAGLFATLRGLQETQIILKTTLLGTIANVFLDYWFFEYGCAYFDLPIEIGLALATVVSQLGMAIFAYYFTQNKFPGTFTFVRIPLPILTYGKFLLGRTLFLNAVLLGAQKIIQPAAPTTIAVHIIYFNCWLFASYFMDGLADAALALSGKFTGEKNTLALKKLNRTIIIQNLCIASLLAGGIYFFQNKIAELFLHDPLSITSFGQNLPFLAFSIVTGAICFSTDGMLTGAGKAPFLMWNMIFSCVVFFFSHLLLQQLALPLLSNLWLALSIWLLSRAVPAFIYSKRLS